MDITKLVRDPEKIHAAIKEIDNKLIAIKPLKIYIPCRFAERNLANIGVETQIVGIYAITLEDMYYGVSCINAMMVIEPTTTLKVVICGNDYYEFSFDAGAVITPSINLVKQDTLVYSIYDEILSKGHIPWYLGYLELGHIFESAKKHANTRVGEQHEVIELLISTISRNPTNRHEYYRSTIKSLDDLKNNPPAFIPLRSVTYGATNTTNKLAGSYFDVGLTSALVSPSERIEPLEKLLRI